MSNFSKFLAALLLLALFVAAGWFGGPTNGLEAGLMRSMAAVRSDWPMLTDVMAGLTRLGGAPVTLGAAGIASMWLLLRGASARALILALVVALERLLVEGLKDWTGRPRPPFETDWLPQSLAYPSGHAANSITTFLAIALIAVSAVHRRKAVVVALLLSLLIGLSRVWLGVHWPSDVIGGWALGVLAVAVALANGERSGALRFEPQHEVVGRHSPPLDKDETA